MSRLLHLCLLDVKRLKPKHEGINTSAMQIAKSRMALNGGSNEEVMEMMLELTLLSARWPKTRNAAYPVEGDCCGFKRAKEAGTLWDNPRRIELLDWLIERTKNHDTGTEATDNGS